MPRASTATSDKVRTMLIKTAHSFSDLLPYQQCWDELAGDSVFRSWLWLSTWWKHYGPNRQLRVVMVFDDAQASTCSDKWPGADALVGILPIYEERQRGRGRVLCLMGDGEVCSEHLDLLCAAHDTDRVTDTLAKHFADNFEDWDLLIFDTVAKSQLRLNQLIEKLSERECTLARRPGANRWTIPLPATWDDFLAMQSKSHRKQLRQLKSRVLESPRARWSFIEIPNDFDVAWEILIDLHQRRRQSLGEPGCFASAMWANFHREVARELLSTGQLRLSVLTLDGEPIAAEYHLASQRGTAAYQGGIDPERREEEPGQLSMILCIERAIVEGHRQFELLRGDEPYKAHWRAKPEPTFDIEVVSPRKLARVRHFSWNGLRRAGRLVRQFANLLS